MPTTGANRIGVAAGVLRDSCGRILVGQRIVEDLYYQKWEFPGGKLEPGESAEHALKRELYEELGIEIGRTEPLIQLSHDYPDRKVRLNVLEVSSFTGTPHGREGQAVRWVMPSELFKLDFLEANKPIMRAVELPDYVYIADIFSVGMEKTLSAVESLVAGSTPAIVQVGTSEAEEKISEQLQYLVSALLDLARDSAVSIYVYCDPLCASNYGAQGVLLDTQQMMSDLDRSGLGNMRVGASCGNMEEIGRAAELELDYILIGPVEAVGSQSQALLGWPGFADLASSARLPAYAVGGLSAADRDKVRQLGGQGVAVSAGDWEGIQGRNSGNRCS